MKWGWVFTVVANVVDALVERRERKRAEKAVEEMANGWVVGCKGCDRDVVLRRADAERLCPRCLERKAQKRGRERRAVGR